MKEGSDWKTYTLGVLFAIVMSVSGLLYANTTQRITKLETQQEEAVRVRIEILTQIAVVQSQLQTVHDNLNNLGEGQSYANKKIDALISGVSRDSKRWNEEMDRIEQEHNRMKK